MQYSPSSKSWNFNSESGIDARSDVSDSTAFLGKGIAIVKDIAIDEPFVSTKSLDRDRAFISSSSYACNSCEGGGTGGRGGVGRKYCLIDIIAADEDRRVFRAVDVGPGSGSIGQNSVAEKGYKQIPVIRKDRIRTSFLPFPLPPDCGEGEKINAMRTVIFSHFPIVTPPSSSCSFCSLRVHKSHKAGFSPNTTVFLAVRAAGLTG